MRHRAESEWLLFADPDEFMHFGPELGDPRGLLPRWLSEQSSEVTELSIKNMVFGGVPERNTGLMIERFTHRSADAEMFGREKSLVRTDWTAGMWVHHSSLRECGSLQIVLPEQVRMNHYVHALDGPESDPVKSDKSASQVGSYLVVHSN